MPDQREEKPKYKVAAPYVTLKWVDRNGSEVITGFYSGAVVPPSADQATVERLLGKDMLVRVDDPVADIVAVPAGTPIPGEPPNVPVPEVPTSSHDDRMARARDLVGKGKGRGDADKPVDKPAGDAAKAEVKAEAKDTPEQPAQTDLKAAWVDYAVAKGASREQAEALSKEQLIGKYGKR